MNNDNNLDNSWRIDDFCISKEHPSLAGHFPGNPIVPAVVMLDRIISGWQNQTKYSVVSLNNAKFITVLRAEIPCTIHYTEKKAHTIHFSLITNSSAKAIVCKGVFQYEC